MSSYGIDQEEICQVIKNPSTGKPISLKTLRKVFREELDGGMAKANAKVAESLFTQAVGAPAMYDSAGRLIRKEVPRNVVAGIFWAKTRMGWKETSKTEISGDNGGPIVITENQARY